MFLLQEVSKAAIDGLKENEMIVNPNKFQAMVAGRGEEIQSEHALRINKGKIKTQSSVNLLELQSDNKLKLNSHLPTILQKAGNK